MRVSNIAFKECWHQIVELLSKRRIPASVYDPRDLQRKIEDRKNSELCPIFVDSYPKGGKNVKVPLSTKEEFVPQEAFYQRYIGIS